MGSRRCSSIPGARGGLSSHLRPHAHLELFKLPSSEAALEGPLFLDNHDLTPSTRSSSSESTSESPSLWDEEQKGRQGWEEVITWWPRRQHRSGTASLSWVGVGCRAACASVSQREQEKSDGGAHHPQGPCPAQQAALCDSHRGDPEEHGGTSTPLSVTGYCAANQSSENDRETVPSSITAKWLLVKKRSPGPFSSSLRPILLFLSACSQKCGYSCCHFPCLCCKSWAAGDGPENRRASS